MWSEGRIIEWIDERGFGFAISPLTDKRVFVHIKEFKRRCRRRPMIGDLIEFHIRHDDRGRAQAALISYVESASSEGTVNPVELAVATLTAGGFGGLLATVIYLGHAPWWILGFYVILGPISACLYRRDKEAAQQGEWRISENTLLLIDLVGGWIGGLFAQILLRHKTRKLPFLAPFWAIVGGHYFLGFLAVQGVLELS